MVKEKTGGMVLCMGCYSFFYVPKYRLGKTKFCSKDCMLTGEVKECEACGKDFYVCQCRVDEARFCSSKCWTQSEESRGIVKENMKEVIKNRDYSKENNPNWRGGITKKHKIRLLTPEWKAKRKEALDYYGGRCFSCGATEELHVHHRIPVRLGGSDDISNLSIFCKRCHAKHEFDYIYLSSVYSFCEKCNDKCNEECPLFVIKNESYFKYEF